MSLYKVFFLLFLLFIFLFIFYLYFYPVSLSVPFNKKKIVLNGSQLGFVIIVFLYFSFLIFFYLSHLLCFCFMSSASVLFLVVISFSFKGTVERDGFEMHMNCMDWLYLCWYDGAQILLHHTESTICMHVINVHKALYRIQCTSLRTLCICAFCWHFFLLLFKFIASFHSYYTFFHSFSPCFSSSFVSFDLNFHSRMMKLWKNSASIIIFLFYASVQLIMHRNMIASVRQ